MSEISQLQLGDGRTLDYRVSGPDGGPVLLYHHGTPGACTRVSSLERAAAEQGLRFVVASRAGYGGSSRNHGRRVVDVVADSRALLDALGAEECLVVGKSGGGPHALACAARLPGARATLVIAGVAPFGAEGLDWYAGMGEDNVVEFGAAVEGEAAVTALLGSAVESVREISPEQILVAIESLLPEVDKAVVSGEYGEEVAEGFREAVRLGIGGWVDDDLAFATPWGFELGEIASPVSLWQGSVDKMVPFDHGRWLSERVPGVTAHLVEGEGHLSIGLGAAGEMLDELIALAGR